MNPKLPTDVIVARGKKHLSKDEVDERRASEVRPHDTSVTPPKWLTTKAQRAEFEKKAQELVEIGIWDALDADELGRYVLAAEAHAMSEKQLTKMLRSGDLDGMKLLVPVVEKHHKQCHELATALGLTPSSRARLAVPPKVKAEQEPDF